MNSFLILCISVFVTSVFAHLLIRSYLLASFVALLLGPLIGCLVYEAISDDIMVSKWIPIMVINTTVFFSPAPFVLGLGVRFARRHYWKSRGSCFKCGHKMDIDIKLPCPKCSWQQECIRKGLCPQCDYDIQGDYNAGCPECGWGREAEA